VRCQPGDLSVELVAPDKPAENEGWGMY
jgi:hypothetical protein